MLDYTTYSALILAVLAKGGYTDGQSSHCLLTGKPIFSLLSDFYSSCEDPFSLFLVCLRY